MTSIVYDAIECTENKLLTKQNQGYKVLTWGNKTHKTRRYKNEKNTNMETSVKLR